MKVHLRRVTEDLILKIPTNLQNELESGVFKNSINLKYQSLMSVYGSSCNYLFLGLLLAPLLFLSIYWMDGKEWMVKEERMRPKGGNLNKVP